MQLLNLPVEHLVLAGVLNINGTRIKTTWSKVYEFPNCSASVDPDRRHSLSWYLIAKKACILPIGGVTNCAVPVESPPAASK